MSAMSFWRARLHYTAIFLGLILLVAFFLRIYRVTEIPPSLNWDEASIGYNAYSILKTGKDEWGESFPLHFKSYGEYKLPAQIYASIPGIYFFGLNEFGVRITPVVYGTLTVLLTFLLARSLFGSNEVAILTAFFLAISPWHIHLTRASFESSFSVFFVVMGMWFFVLGLKTPKILFLSVLAFAFSVYTYNSARVFAPLFLFCVSILYAKQLMLYKKYAILSAALFAVLLIPFISFVLSGEGSARYKLVSITDDAGLVPRINERRGQSQMPGLLPVLIHNKVTYISFYFARNYVAHFDPRFLFVSGAPHKQHHVQGVGEMYFYQAFFVIAGLILLFYKRSKFRFLLILWLGLSFVPVAVTKDSIPHALRTLIAAPVYQLLTAYGLYYAFSWFRNRGRLVGWIFALATVVIGIWSLGGYLHNYYTKYPYLYSRDWQYGYKQVVEFIGKHYIEYDSIVFSRHFGEPHMFTLFYLQFDPARFQSDPGLVRFTTYDWVRVLKFDKFYFPDLGDEGTKYTDVVKENRGKRILFIGKEGDFPPNLNRLLTVHFLDSKTAFELVEQK